jgi:FAD/FMN-containing dehydrogenase
MAATEIVSEQLEGLRTGFSGQVLEPTDDGFDAARRIHNGLIDRRPALIARCQSAADIGDAVRFAREHGLELSVRGGGHNVAGRAVIDGALMVDLSPMKGIYVDPARRTARAQGGVLWRELNRESAVHGLAVTGGAISHTGIAGLTLGGGLGWLMAKHGLAADNLLSVELVTADGSVIEVNEETDPDLLWGLRGGGGNFGIAASFEYRLFPLTMVTGGLIVHPFERARDLLQFYREAAPGTSDDLTVFAALVQPPGAPPGMKAAGMMVFHTGTEDEAEKEIAPFKAWGEPIMVEVGRMPYPVMNTLLDDAYPTGSFNYWLSNFTTGLDDGLIDALVERYETVPSPGTNLLLEHFHGAVCRVGESTTAVPHRQAGWNLVIPGTWFDPSTTDENIAWVRETHAAVKPHLSESKWLNYLADDQGDDAVRAAYGPNYDRLRELKRRVDPDNVFRHNHNIAP